MLPILLLLFNVRYFLVTDSENRQDRTLALAIRARGEEGAEDAAKCTATSRPLRRSDLPSGRRTCLAPVGLSFFLFFFFLPSSASSRPEHPAVYNPFVLILPKISFKSSRFLLSPQGIPE